MKITIPELGESITEGTIASWMKEEGEAVQAGDLLLELETDKVNLEITADTDGILDQITKQAGESVQVGEAVGTIREAVDSDHSVDTEYSEDTDAAGETKVEDVTVNDQTSDNKPMTESITGSPSVRRIAREKGIDLKRVRTDDPLGRVSHEDIAAHQEKTSEESESNSSSSPKDSTRPIERIPMSRRRITIAKHLVEAQRTAAMLTTFNEVDMSAIMDIRKRRKQSFREKHEVNLGYMSFFCKAVVGALKLFPRLNAEIDGEEMLLKHYYDIGIAVSAEEGLVVPVVRGVDRLSFAEIEQQIGALASKAKTNKLALSDLQGGTFTITNGGVFGSLLSTPILNAPQVGILGMHTIQRRPVALDDHRMENRPMMYVALSYDHRIVDGSEAVKFLITIKELLEDPEMLFIEG